MGNDGVILENASWGDKLRKRRKRKRRKKGKTGGWDKETRATGTSNSYVDGGRISSDGQVAAGRSFHRAMQSAAWGEEDEAVIGRNRSEDIKRNINFNLWANLAQKN
ncbi:hypothetical protein AWENTII_004771 [Aspergillus wentii]